MFSQLTFENLSFSNKLFRLAILNNKGMVYALKKVQIKFFFFFSKLVKTSIRELRLKFAATAINYVCGVLKETYSRNCRFLKIVALQVTTTVD